MNFFFLFPNFFPNAAKVEFLSDVFSLVSLVGGVVRKSLGFPAVPDSSTTVVTLYDASDLAADLLKVSTHPDPEHLKDTFFFSLE